MKIIAIVTILNIVFAQSEIKELSGLSDTLQIDRKNSQIEWIGRKVTGEHSGTLGLSEGWVVMNESVLISGKFIFDMTSIIDTDIESPKYKEMLEGHLKSDDFFNVKEFPVAVLNITNAQKVKEGNIYKIVADLTIKGITHSIAFQADVNVNGLNYLATAKIKIDRTKWDIKYNSGNFFKDLGDKLILDEIEFDIFLLSVK